MKTRLIRAAIGVCWFCYAALLFFCDPVSGNDLGKVDSGKMPDRVIWAWQRPENLEFLNPKEFAVAYLACRVLLTESTMKIHWRNQSLKLPPGAVLVPVVRVDADSHLKPSLNEQQLEELSKLIETVAQRPNIAEIQIDFDALESERDFYRKLLERLQRKLAGKVPISITALASWCLFDNWIRDLPVDETVPMMFSLGRDRQKILLYFREGKDFMVSGCCKSLGISLEDEEVNKVMIPLLKQRKIPVRVFAFTKTAWTAQKIQTLRNLLSN